jgi:nucleoid-associated protein YgaU
VQFEINPEKVTLSHKAKVKEIAASSNTDLSGSEKTVALGQEALLQEVGATSLGLSDLTFTGANVATNCKQLLDWTNPTTSAGGTKNPKLPNLKFIWGTTLSYPVNLISADVTYDRFTAGGMPIRAKVKLTFNIRSSPPAPTNPSSGGVPGRRSHTLVAGENLQHVAMASYGRPGAWRALAAANGIEDPLAVRPGTVIYVPAPTELADGRPEWD